MTTQQRFNNLALCIVPGEMPDALALQEKLFKHSDEFSHLIENWELDKAFLVLNQICNSMSELHMMNQRRVGYDKGIRDATKDLPGIHNFLSHMAKAGAGLTMVHVQIGAHHDTN